MNNQVTSGISTDIVLNSSLPLKPVDSYSIDTVDPDITVSIDCTEPSEALKENIIDGKPTYRPVGLEHSVSYPAASSPSSSERLPPPEVTSQETGFSMLSNFRRRLKQHLTPGRSSSLHKSMHDLSLSPKKTTSSPSASSSYLSKNDTDSVKSASTTSPSSSSGSKSNLTQDVPEDISGIQKEHEIALQNVSSLTEAQVQLLQSTWNLVKQHIEKIGVITFLGIFEQHSDFRDAFTEFRKNKFVDIKHDPAMQVHGLRVLSIMDKLVTRLPKTDDIEKQLMTIGTKHCRYVPTIGLVSSVSDQLWGAIEPVLKEEGLWSDNVAQTWITVLDYLTKTVRYGLAKTFRSTTWT
ncbi:unnamed protein product [Trichobilharzia szidati]|nr:unnamed protein product [Trichobilharzia szidati]